jgi:hypothetical protein
MTEDFGNIVISPQARVLTAKLSRTPPPSPPGVLEAHKFIAEAQKYINEGTDNIASVDAGIDHDPLLKGHPALRARQCVAAYNQLPADLRRMKEWPRPMAAIPRDDLEAMAACVEHASPAYFWWGYVVYMNDCLVNDIMAVTATGGAIAGVIAFACPPCAAVAGVIALYLALQTALLQWANQHCGNQGVYVVGLWVSVPWVTTIC